MLLESIRKFEVIMRRLKLKKARYITGLSFAPDSSRLLALSGYEASGVEQATYVDVASGATQRTFPLLLTDRFVLPADHSRLVIASDVYSRSDSLVRWCDPRNEEIKWTPLMTGAGWPGGASWLDGTSCLDASAMALTPDQNSLVVAIGQQRLQGGTNWTYFLSTCRLDGAEQPVIREVRLPIVGLAAAPGGDPRWAVSHANYHPGQPPEVTLHHHINDPPAARRQFHKALQAAEGLTFSPDGRLLAFHLKRDIHILDGLTLTAVQTVKGHQKQLNAIAFSPDSRSLLSASHDGTIRVWDAATGKSRNRYDWEMGPVLSLAFSPNGLTCAAGGTRGQMVIWDWDA
jgi:WD40 repeat protein